MKNNKKVNKSYTLSQSTIDRMKDFKKESTFEDAMSYLLDFYEESKRTAKGKMKAKIFIKDLIMKKEPLEINISNVRKLTGCRLSAVKEAIQELGEKINIHNKNI